MQLKQNISARIVAGLIFLNSLLPLTEGCKTEPIGKCGSNFRPVPAACISKYLGPDNRDMIFDSYILHLEGIYRGMVDAAVSDGKTCKTLETVDFVYSDIVTVEGKMFAIMVGRSVGIRINDIPKPEDGEAEIFIEKLPFESSLSCGEILFEGRIKGSDNIEIQLEGGRVIKFHGVGVTDTLHGIDGATFVMRPGEECGIAFSSYILRSTEGRFDINMYGQYWFTLEATNVKRGATPREGEADVKIWKDCSIHAE